MGRQLLQEKLNKKEVRVVVTKEIQHSVHKFGRLAVAQPLEEEKSHCSLSVGKLKNLQRVLRAVYFYVAGGFFKRLTTLDAIELPRADTT